MKTIQYTITMNTVSYPYVPPEESNKSVSSVRNSNFHILINTNQNFQVREAIQDSIRCFYRTLQFIFCDISCLRQIIFVNTEKRPGTSFDTDVGKINSEATIEYAKTGLHAHILMRVYHLTYVRIDLPALRALFRSVFDSFHPRIPFKNAFVHVDAIRDSIGNVREYIYKDVGSRKIKYRKDWDYPERQEVTVSVSIANMSEMFSVVPPGIPPDGEGYCHETGTAQIRRP